MSLGQLYLLPVSLGDVDWPAWLPTQTREIACRLRHFVVENEKTARAELKRLGHPQPLRELDIRALPEKPDPRALEALLAPALDGEDIGLMSEAGCPAVADPGALLVRQAHAMGIAARPLVGPSSILLALMASGLDGQSFAFHGYLPVNDTERQRALKTLEQDSRQHRRTQIFIETPYRNAKMLEGILQGCAPSTRLCVARDLTTPDELVISRRIADWRRTPPPDLAKHPAIFLLLAD